MHIGELIREYRRKNNLTMEEFAKLIGRSKAYVSMLEKNKNSRSGKEIAPSAETLKSVANVFGITIDELLKMLDENQLIKLSNSNRNRVKGIRIPILGHVVAGIPLEAIEDIEGYEEITPEMSAKGEYFALRIKGNSMLPSLREGDIVIVHKQDYIESGQTAIVLVNGDEATVKRVKYQENGIILVGENADVYPPHFYTKEEIETLPVSIIGRVVESRRSWS